eukprot:2259620-Amphidinium_carterae.4
MSYSLGQLLQEELATAEEDRFDILQAGATPNSWHDAQSCSYQKKRWILYPLPSFVHWLSPTPLARFSRGRNSPSPLPSAHWNGLLSLPLLRLLRRACCYAILRTCLLAILTDA